MKITRRITKEEQIEVQFPHYSKDDVCHWYKVISENKMIKIYSGSEGYCSLDLTEYNISSAFEDTKTIITEQEFNEKYNEVLNIITNNL
jgi:hypothetical protein